MAHIEKTIEVNAPVEVAYKRSTKFEQYPKFMPGVRKVERIEPSRYHWVTDRDGGKEYDSRIVEQRPNRSIAWTREGPEHNDGQMMFTPLDSKRTLVRFAMDFEPAGEMSAGEGAYDMHARQFEEDVQRYKEFIESSNGRSAIISPTRMLTTPHLNPLEWISVLLLAIGGINWGLIGWRHYNAVEAFVGERGRTRTAGPRMIYLAIGLSAVYTLCGLLRAEAMTFRRERKMYR